MASTYSIFAAPREQVVASGDPVRRTGPGAARVGGRKDPDSDRVALVEDLDVADGGAGQATVLAVHSIRSFGSFGSFDETGRFVSDSCVGSWIGLVASAQVEAFDAPRTQLFALAAIADNSLALAVNGKRCGECQCEIMNHGIVKQAVDCQGGGS